MKYSNKSSSGILEITKECQPYYPVCNCIILQARLDELRRRKML